MWGLSWAESSPSSVLREGQEQNGAFVQGQAGLRGTNPGLWCRGCTSSRDCAHCALLGWLLSVFIYFLLLLVVVEWSQAGVTALSPEPCPSAPSLQVTQCSVQAAPARIPALFPHFSQGGSAVWAVLLCALLEGKGGGNPSCCRNERKGEEGADGEVRAALHPALHPEDVSSTAWCYLLWPHKMQRVFKSL